MAGAGIDTVAYNQSWGNYSFAFIYKIENEFRGVVFGASGFDYLWGIEKISFNGVILSFTPNTLSFNVYSSIINVDNPAAQTLIEASQNYTLINSELYLRLTGSNFINGTGNSLSNIIWGNTGNNILIGLAGDDILDGGLGADTLDGGLGNDTYYIDNIADVIINEQDNGGVDTVVTSAPYYNAKDNYIENIVVGGSFYIDVTGNDLDNIIIGNYNPNVLIGGGGNDTIFGSVVSDSGYGGDKLYGGNGNDVLYGYGFANLFDGGLGADTYYANSPNDYNNYYIDNIGDVIFGDVADDYEEQSRSHSSLFSSVNYSIKDLGVEKFTLTGTENINAQGNNFANVITGNVGNNLLDGGLGADTLVGGEGQDTAIYHGSWSQYSISGSVENAIVTGAEGTDSLISIESLRFNGVSVAIADAINDAPIGVNDNNGSDAVIEFGLGGASDASAVGNVLSNDSDADEGLGLGETKTVSAVAGQLSNVGVAVVGTYGSVVINADGTYTYTLNNSDLDTQALSAGQTVADNFNYTVVDAHGLTGTATLTISISGSNDGLTVQSAVSYTLGSGEQELVLTGVANIDGTGNSLDNIITGNSGNNRLNGGIGADAMTGGLGNDIYYVDNVGDVVTENVGEGTDTVYAAINYSLTANVEYLGLLGTSNLTGTGNELNNSLTGNSGNNRLSGGLGNDALNGGLGADTLTGGLGNDTYYLDNVGDVVTESLGEGTDTVYASINYSLTANVENVLLQGTAHLNGTGNDLNNSLTGNSGNNILNGGVGKDTLSGGLGDDTYYVDNTTDVITEQAGAGTDTVYSTETYTLAANIESLVLQGTANINGTGNALDNVLTGNAGNNVLNGSTGVDIAVYGLWNNYSVVGNALNATVSGGDGTDTLMSIESLKFNGVSVSVADAVNDAPIGVNDNNGSDAVIEMGTGIAGDANAVGNVLSNDTDADAVLGLGETKTVRAVAGQQSNVGSAVVGIYGSVVINADGTYIYTLDNNDLDTDALSAGQSVNDSFSYTVIDAHGLMGTATLAISIVGSLDRVQIQSAVSYVLKTGEHDLLLTGTANVNGTGNSLDNIMIGNSGNNVLDGGLGADTLMGGLGNDVYTIDNVGDVVTEGLGEGTDIVYATIDYSLVANVESFIIARRCQC